MKLLLDMNLSPEWTSVLEAAGYEAVHWSDIGPRDAPDSEILDFAKADGYVVFTHDLDFGTILATTNANCPSVIQIRTQDVTPSNMGHLVVSALRQFENYLKEGALITIDQKRLRARILPIKPLSG